LYTPFIKRNANLLGEIYPKWIFEVSNAEMIIVDTSKMYIFVSQMHPMLSKYTGNS